MPRTKLAPLCCRELKTLSGIQELFKPDAPAHPPLARGVTELPFLGAVFTPVFREPIEKGVPFRIAHPYSDGLRPVLASTDETAHYLLTP